MRMTAQETVAFAASLLTLPPAEVQPTLEKALETGALALDDFRALAAQYNQQQAAIADDPTKDPKFDPKYEKIITDKKTGQKRIGLIYVKVDEKTLSAESQAVLAELRDIYKMATAAREKLVATIANGRKAPPGRKPTLYTQYGLQIGFPRDDGKSSNGSKPTLDQLFAE